MEKQVKWGKWFALGLGGLIGLSHIGMIGSLSNRESKLPSINLPVGPYTSYEADVGHNGYSIVSCKRSKSHACGTGYQEKRWVSWIG